MSAGGNHRSWLGRASHTVLLELKLVFYILYILTVVVAILLIFTIPRYPLYYLLTEFVCFKLLALLNEECLEISTSSCPGRPGCS